MVKSRLFLLMLPVAIVAPVPTAAQAPGAAPLSAVLEDRDRDRVPDRLGDTVSVVAVATSAPLRIGERAWVLNVQDEHAGATLFTRDSTTLRGVLPGDTLRIDGVVGQYRGAEQIQAQRVRRLGSGPVPAPRDVLAADVLSERFSGRLVRVSGELAVTPRDGQPLEVTIRDRSGEVPVMVRQSDLADPAFTTRLLEGGPAEVTGIAGQFKRSPPFDSGYELIPRDVSDFRFAPIPPYRRIALGGLLLGLVALALYLAARRRSAERQARELAALSESLRRSEQALRKSEQRFRSLIEHAHDIIAILDADGILRFESEAVRSILGYAPEAVVGTSGFGRCHPDDLPRVSALFRELVADPGGIRETEARFRRKDGGWSVLQIVAQNLLHDPAVEGIVVNARDITDRRAAEDALRESEERLRQSQKMEAVGRLAGGVAHDFNNLLTVILGNAQFLLADTPAGGAPGREELKEILDASRRASTLTRQLLAFSRRQVLQPCVLSLNDAVAEAERMLRRLVGADVEMRTELDPAPGQVHADPGQIQQVILNLVVNAREAMPDVGVLTIRTGGVTVGPGDAGADLLAPGSYAVLRVTDTGQGVPGEIRDKIFEPFFSTKEHGSGLGLATVYGVVRQSGGMVRVQSGPGEGASFAVYLPCVDVASEPGEAPAPDAPPQPGAETILVVEDEDSVRSLTLRILRRAGYAVMEAANADEALRLSAAHEGEIHLTLTDVVMPGMRGPELAERLVQERPEMRVLYMSGYTSDISLPLQFGNLGAELLHKPFAPDDLVRRVRRSLDAREPAPAT